MLNLIILLCIICFIIIFSFVNEIKLKRIYLFSIGILVFCWIPIGVDYFIVKGFVQDTTIQWTKAEWAGFLGSYLGGSIGAVITLFGVWWQIKRDDKIKQRDKVIGVLKGILYSLNKNLEDKKLEYHKKQSFYVLDYYCENLVHFKFYNSYIYEIFPEIIKENYKIIFELNFGKEIVDLNELIKNFNKNHKFLSLQLKRKQVIIKEIEEFINSNAGFYSGTKVNDILKKIKELSNFFFSTLSEDTKEILEKGKELHENVNNLLSIISAEEDFLKKSNKLEQYILSEAILLNKETNIFKIITEMEDIKGKIEKEIKKLENQ